MSRLWINDQNGKPSVIVTMLTVSFIATTFAYVVSTVDRVGPVSVRPFDAVAAFTYFGSVLTAFVACRWLASRRIVVQEVK